jgi:membrane protein implicated in regulation of membrane protease activity
MLIGDCMSLIWGIIIVLLIFLELMTVDIVAIWYALAAITSLIVSFTSDNFALQFTVFVIVGSLLMMILRNITIEFLKAKSIITSVDKIVGEKGIVTMSISKKQYGEVRVNKKRWTAYADVPIIKNTKVVVLSVDGVKLKVEPKK